MPDTGNKVLNVALVGNPNSGKSTLFNALTGLNQKTGNFPGVTVEKRSGQVRISSLTEKTKRTVNFIDLPGTYCLFPKSLDELETFKTLTEPTDRPDAVIIVVDSSNLKRSLLLCMHVIDLGIPAILAANMIDLLERSHLSLNTERLEQELGIPVVTMNARDKKGLSVLKNLVLKGVSAPKKKFENPAAFYHPTIAGIQTLFKSLNDYEAFLVAANSFMITDKKEYPAIKEILEKNGLNSFQMQSEESLRRFAKIEEILKNVVVEGKGTRALRFTYAIDKILTHPVFGFVIFLGILFLIFQSIFSLSEIPMDIIDGLFQKTGAFISENLPKGRLNDLLAQGIIPGLGGILMFIPQIAILFAFIAILEDSGYMSRVSFIMDRLMRKFGINGKSIIPLISGVACAVPAIMATRTIKNRKERLITLLVTPLMSCSARLPVYTLLIAIAVPEMEIGWFNIKGLILMGLYLIGFLAAMGTALLLKWIIRSKENSYFIMELPVYRMPKFPVVAYTMYDKVKVFVLEAGKVIIAVSIVLWALSSFGPGDRFSSLERKYTDPVVVEQMGEKSASDKLASEKLRNSYAGLLGKSIEPVIAPLGFDWKIGIALITSFAAREVFVGTMATIYGVGADDTSSNLRTRMSSDINAGTGKKLFTPAAAFALIIFYAFAMQCMSTLAVVFRETGGWKWPTLQFIYMSALAWISAFVVYNLFK